MKKSYEWAELNMLSAKNVHSVVEALLTLLDSFDEPVIPYDFYQRCLDAHDNAALSRQVIHCTPAVITTVPFIITLLLYSSDCLRFIQELIFLGFLLTPH